MSDLKEIVRSAKNIGVPKGESNQACRDAFEREADFELPPFDDGKLFASTQGVTVWLLRGIDIYRRIEESRIDVGAIGTDVLMNNPFRAGLVARRIGGPICRFSLLAENSMAATIEATIDEDLRCTTTPMKFPTAYPKMLSCVAAWRDLPIAPLDMKITGSVEAYARLTGLGRVADIVNTGETARKNELSEVFKLCDIYPELIWRQDSETL